MGPRQCVVGLQALDLCDMQTNICLIIPCFNEAARLDFDRFSELPPGVRCLLVDDGSTDETASIVRRHESDVVSLLQLPRNVGKAEAVRQGVLHAKRSGLLEGADWVGYWDADLATPFSELEGFIAYGSIAGGTVDGILGSRIYKLGSRIVRSYTRHLLGRVFATAVAVLLKLDCYDSQCGAKLFKTEFVDEAFAQRFVSRWIFDIEILARLRNRRLIEYPLKQWVDVEGSKMRAMRVAIPALVDLVRIRRQYGV